jgi:hypothetical protein
MKKVLLALISLLASNIMVAQIHHNEHAEPNPNISPYNDALDATNGVSGIKFNKQSAWKNFEAKHANWGCKFNPYTGMPHRAVGPGINIGNGNPAQLALQFLQTELAAYNIPVNELALISNKNDGKYTNVNYKQVHNGHEVCFSRINVRLTQDNKIIMAGVDVYNNIPNLTTSLTNLQALDYAKASITTPITGASVLPVTQILPVPIDGKMEFFPVYVVIINTQDTKEQNGIYYTLVDANTGKVWYRHNKVVNITGSVKGYTMARNAWSPKTLNGLPHIQMEVNSVLYNADASGNFNIPVTSGSTGFVDLQGKYCKVVDGATATASTASPYINATFTSGGTIVFDTTAAATKTTKVNCYYHTNVVHDFMKSKLPLFTAMDNALLTRVDRTDGDCNAFYNGTSINFYEAGNGCSPTGTIADVVYHEYGHGITNVFWDDNGLNFDNGAMGEGYSDMWAMSIQDWPVIGPGFYTNSSITGIRRYDQAPAVYPQDIVGEVHADGEIIAGAWWDTYQNWGDLDSTASLFAISHYGLANGPDGAEGQVYFDILIDALTYDDNDGNIANGTPHFNAIVPAFARHGIYLLADAEIAHQVLPNVVPNATGTLNANVTVSFPAFMGDLKMFHRFKKSGTVNPTDSTLCTNNGSGNYSVSYPSAVEGKVLDYYFAAYDISNAIFGTNPKNAAFTTQIQERNIPYHVVYGMQAMYTEDFEGAATNWTIGLSTDNATTAGRWVLAKPVGSRTSGANGDTVQTYVDHTSGTGKCLVTGNATSGTSPAGNADVDGGRTTVASPVFNLDGMADPIISYWRWYSNSQSSTNPRKDQWRVLISNNGGTTFTTYTERTYEPDVRWRRHVIRLKDITTFSNLSQVVVLFIATDSVATGGQGTWVEAALDDFTIMDKANPASINATILQADIYPNPANDVLYIDLDNMAENIQANLMDATGKLVYNITAISTSNFQIPTSNIAEGMYMLQINADNKKHTFKVLIKH